VPWWAKTNDCRFALPVPYLLWSFGTGMSTTPPRIHTPGPYQLVCYDLYCPICLSTAYTAHRVFMCEVLKELLWNAGKLFSDDAEVLASCKLPNSFHNQTRQFWGPKFVPQDEFGIPVELGAGVWDPFTRSMTAVSSY
jgi:hypothetical protein